MEWHCANMRSQYNPTWSSIKSIKQTFACKVLNQISNCGTFEAVATTMEEEEADPSNFKTVPSLIKEPKDDDAAALVTCWP